MIVRNSIREFRGVGEKVEEEVVHVMDGGGAIVVMGLGMGGKGRVGVDGGGVVGLVHGVIVVVVVVVVVMPRSWGIGRVAKGI